MQYCKNCRKEIHEGEHDINGYCSEKCEQQAKKTSFTTMSVRVSTRNRLIRLQNDVLSKTNVKVSYSDLIEHSFDILENMLPVELSDKIIEEYKYYL